jgi:hypothetical protein
MVINEFSLSQNEREEDKIEITQLSQPFQGQRNLIFFYYKVGIKPGM